MRRSLVAVGAELSAALGPAALHLVGDEIGLDATPVPELGLVGEPLPCRPAAVEEALAAGRIPIVTPIAVGPLNVNADEAATALAAGLGADRIVFVSDVPGVYVEGAVADAAPCRRRGRSFSAQASSTAASSRSCSRLPGPRDSGSLSRSARRRSSRDDDAQ